MQYTDTLIGIGVMMVAGEMVLTQVAKAFSRARRRLSFRRTGAAVVVSAATDGEEARVGGGKRRGPLPEAPKTRAATAALVLGACCKHSGSPNQKLTTARNKTTFIHK